MKIFILGSFFLLIGCSKAANKSEKCSNPVEITLGEERDLRDFESRLVEVERELAEARSREILLESEIANIDADVARIDSDLARR